MKATDTRPPSQPLQRSRKAFLYFLIALGIMLAGCAASMKYEPLLLPCPDTPPDIRKAANETRPRPLKVALPAKLRSEQGVAYFVVEPTGSVNPDSIMLCGIVRPLLRDEIARTVALTSFAPGTRDGRPVRMWSALFYNRKPDL